MPSGTPLTTVQQADVRTNQRSVGVLMICPQFAPMVGGAERAAERLAGALAARGHQVTVISEWRDRQWPRVEPRDGFVIERVPCLYRRHVHRISAQIALGCHLVRRLSACDVIQLSPPGPMSEIVLGLARLWRRPTVIRPSSTGRRGIGKATEGWRGVFGRALERRADACIALTPVMAKEARRFGVPEERIHIIPNGIDTLRWRSAGRMERQAIRSQLGISGSDIVVLYVGRLSREKNVHGLLQAWAGLVRAGRASRARLVLVGDGPERAALEAVIQARGLRASVLITGFVADTLPWYQAGDIVALPSEHEGLPNCVLEAMSCELPVVAVRTALPDEVVGGTDVGELIPTWVPESFAAALARLIEDEGYRQRCGAAGRQRAREEYDMGGVVARVEALYHLILGKRGSTGSA